MPSNEQIFLQIQPRFDGVIRLPIFRGEDTFTVPVVQLHGVMTALKKDFGFNYLVDISSVDNMGNEPRFEIVYEVCNLETLQHIRIKTTVDEETPVVPTITNLWRTADWHEREIYDMMGIKFSGHPDLRRILMWDGYPYYPLRKDFPLAGKPTDLPDIAFTKTAPLEGGPFVTSPTAATTSEREPRAKPADVVERHS